VKTVADALRISRPHLSATAKAEPTARGPYSKSDDPELLERIRAIVKARPACGYRRVTAYLNRAPDVPRVNHKRVYRMMRESGLLLAKYAQGPERAHTGRIITLASNMRWCSDSFEIRCWNGERVHVAFSLDCCDREAIGWVAANRHLDGADIRDLIALSVEARFGATTATRPVEWLTDNGPPYTANETRAFASAGGLLPRNTPAYSPESNGMAEAFVRTIKRDYVYLADLPDADTVLAMLPTWLEDYNEHQPHKGLRMLSPRQFRRLQTHNSCPI
jgi:transposase InsO family protein